MNARKEKRTPSCKSKSIYQCKGKLVIFEKPSGGPFDGELNKYFGPHSGGGGVLMTSGSITWKNKTMANTVAGTLLFLINSDIASQLKFSHDFDGYILWMSESFIDSLSIDMSRSELLQSYGSEPCLKSLTTDDAATLANYIKLIAIQTDENDGSNEEGVIGLLVKALYYKSLSKMSVIANDNIHNQKEQLTKEFFMLVRKYGHQHRDLEFYADKMCITSKYLSSAITKASGKRTHQWLEDATMNKAKYLLMETDNQICRIAEILNFYSSADFVRYFRVREGKTPLQYKRTPKL